MTVRRLAALALITAVVTGGSIVRAPISMAQGSPPPVARMPPASCGREDFVAVVEQAASVLRDLNHQQRPRFQERLRQLKDKRGWSHDRFMAEAVPFVQDEKITAFDARSAELLDRINTMGETGGAAPKPECDLLIDLRAYMKELVDTQKAKWDYMFAKLESALKE